MTKSVLVSGAATGFGPEIALHLAEQGFSVYAAISALAGRDDLAAAAASRRVALRVVPLDVADQVHVDRTIATIVAEAGSLYGVVCNDTHFVRGYFEDLSDVEIRQVFETNLFGAMAITRAALPHMRVARRGRIVIISSVAGKVGAPVGSAYSASRFAQEGFAESLYQEVKPLGLSVSLIEPGITKTATWTVDLCAAERARDPASPYYEWFNRSERIFDRAMHATRRTPNDIARAVYLALTADRPRLRYAVGRQARLVMTMRRYLPGEVFERLYFGEVMRRVTGD